MFKSLFSILNVSKRSSNWKKVRQDHLDKFASCAACGRTTKLEVHHIEPFHLNPSRELDPSNLITLCDSPCHLVFGHLMSYKSWNKNVIKDCQKYLEAINHRP